MVCKLGEPESPKNEMSLAMNRTLTAEEIKQAYIEIMGNSLGKQFCALRQEVVWLHSIWREYVELFGTKPSRIELLNKSAGFFFVIVADSLWEATLLHIARLTDPPKSAGKKNLTIQVLPTRVHEKVRESVQDLVNIAIERAEFCRDWRNRRIAHRDLRLAIEEGVKPLTPASRRDVWNAIASIDNVLNAITFHYKDSTTNFDVVQGSDGAEALLYVLDDGLRAEAERSDRIRRREYRKEDLAIRDL